MQLSLFEEQDRDKILTDLFQAYFDARKNKRNTLNALAYKRHFEANTFALCDEILAHSYQPGPGICFIVDKPVKREIFAASFRDRIVHHFIYDHIAPLFENSFINDSYSCRTGKETHYGIKRIDRFVRACSQNYQRDCYILKLDIKGYFMSINRKLLFDKIKSVLLCHSHKIDFDLPLILYLIEKTIFNDPTKKCTIKGKKSDWTGLQVTKSLFHASKNCGLPIGNRTSQLFGNIYLNDFDQFVKRDLGIRYYGRYVDDFILVHRDKEYLKSIMPEIRNYLSKYLQLELHPDKIYLQHYSKGVKYLGAVIKPHRIYIANRTKGSFYEAITKQNIIARDYKPTTEEREFYKQHEFVFRYYETL